MAAAEFEESGRSDWGQGLREQAEPPNLWVQGTTRRPPVFLEKNKGAVAGKQGRDL